MRLDPSLKPVEISPHLLALECWFKQDVAAARVDVELHRLAEGFEHAVKLGAFARGSSRGRRARVSGCSPVPKMLRPYFLRHCELLGVSAGRRGIRCGDAVHGRSRGDPAGDGGGGAVSAGVEWMRRSATQVLSQDNPGSSSWRIGCTTSPHCPEAECEKSQGVVHCRTSSDLRSLP